VSWLQEMKLLLMGSTGLSKDALHIYVGLAVFLLALTRWRIGSLPPLLVVLAVALAGEAWDFIDNIRTEMPMQWAGHRHDIWNTLFWPAVLTGLGRWTGLFRRGR
jgi:hypothetical protein